MKAEEGLPLSGWQEYVYIERYGNMLDEQVAIAMEELHLNKTETQKDNHWSNEKMRMSKSEREKQKSEKFKKLAERRTEKAINHIKLIGNLANRANYSWEEKDRKKIFQAIDRELKYAKERFGKSSKSRKENKFSLDD